MEFGGDGSSGFLIIVIGTGERGDFGMCPGLVNFSTENEKVKGVAAEVAAFCNRVTLRKPIAALLNFATPFSRTASSAFSFTFDSALKWQ